MYELIFDTLKLLYFKFDKKIKERNQTMACLFFLRATYTIILLTNIKVSLMRYCSTITPNELKIREYNFVLSYRKRIIYYVRKPQTNTD